MNIGTHMRMVMTPEGPVTINHIIERERARFILDRLTRDATSDSVEARNEHLTSK